MQNECPVSHVDWQGGGKIWAVTKHADVRAVLADARFSSDRSLPGHPLNQVYVAGNQLKQLIEMDPPEHTEARVRVMREFTVRRIAAMRPRLTEVVNETIDAMMDGKSEAELVTALSLPVPSIAISELLGVPAEDHEFFQRHSSAFAKHNATVEDRMAAVGTLKAYIAELVNTRVATPGDDLLSRQLEAGATPEEVVGLGFLLLIAGHETTANMISLSIVTLLDNPELLQQLRDDPDLLSGAIEELLRYFTIAEIGGLRLATADIEIGGTMIPEGGVVFAAANVANRDPEAFPEPHTIDFKRGARNHVAFGFGPHQCLGQSLARLELEIVLSTVIRRIPTLRLAVPFQEIRFKENGPTYGVYELPVAW